LAASDSNYRHLVFDNLHATAFQGTGMARSPLGTTKTLGFEHWHKFGIYMNIILINYSRNVTGKDVAEFAADSCKPTRMVLTGVGGVDHGQLEQLAQKYSFPKRSFIKVNKSDKKNIN
jgi:predicted Zn-dependent peptidase